jgi:NTE family protein
MSMTEIDTKSQGNFDRKTLGQVVLVFQGGGALGAYQAGVYEGEHQKPWGSSGRGSE